MPRGGSRPKQRHVDIAPFLPIVDAYLASALVDPTYATELARKSHIIRSKRASHQNTDVLSGTEPTEGDPDGSQGQQAQRQVRQAD